MRLLRRNAPRVPACLQRSASASNARFSPAENWRRLAVATTSGSGAAAGPGHPFTRPTGSLRDAQGRSRGSAVHRRVHYCCHLWILPLDTKLPKAVVPGHIGTQGGRTIRLDKQTGDIALVEAGKLTPIPSEVQLQQEQIIQQARVSALSAPKFFPPVSVEAIGGKVATISTMW